jgi:nitric oxide reductase large subunit
VAHLWVEQSFEFFAAAISAYLLMAVGLVSRQLAERSVYLELILIFLGGVLATGHHLYWAGEPGLWVPLGTMFSFIEVLPPLGWEHIALTGDYVWANASPPETFRPLREVRYPFQRRAA